jgi:hypothetical protein
MIIHKILIIHKLSNSLFSMNLFNQAIQRLAPVDSSFLSIISSQTDLQNQITNMKQLLYSQTDFDTINTSNFESTKFIKVIFN